MDMGSAIDEVIVRDGWIAARADGWWALPVPLATKPHRLATGICRPALDPSCVWFETDAESWVKYDGRLGDVRTTISLEGWWIEAELPSGLLLKSRRDRTHRLVDVDDPTNVRGVFPAHDFVGRFRDRSIWSPSPASIRISNHDGHVEADIDLPLWRCTGSAVSPDERMLAVAGEGVFGPLPLDMNPKERAKRKLQRSIIAIIDLETHVVIRVDGQLAMSSRPVWCADSTWLFVNGIAEGKLYAIDMREHCLRPVPTTRRHPPVPLLDMATSAR